MQFTPMFIVIDFQGQIKWAADFCGEAVVYEIQSNKAVSIP